MPTAEALVDGAYRAILGRDPDPDGRRHAVATLEAGMGVAEFLRNLLESAEYRREAGDPLRFRTTKPVCTLLDGRLKLWIDLADSFVSLGCLADDYEPSETRFVLDSLAPGDVFLDIGANVGWFAIKAADRVGPSGRVHAFEPRAATFALLERSIADNGFGDRVQAHRIALGDAGISGRLIGAEGSTNLGGFRLARGDAEHFHGMISEPVDVRPLDGLNLVGPVRLIKLDVEGAEPAVLRGARGLLARDRPIILCEVFGPGLRHVSGVGVAEFAGLAGDLGYRIHALEDGAAGPEIRDPAVLDGEHPVNVALIPV